MNVQHAPKPTLGLHVKKSSRLVQHQPPVRLKHGPRHHHLLSLPVAQFRQPRLGQDHEVGMPSSNLLRMARKRPNFFHRQADLMRRPRGHTKAMDFVQVLLSSGRIPWSSLDIEMSPDWAGSAFASVRNNVDFPAPLPPKRRCIPPAFQTWVSGPRSAFVRLCPTTKFTAFKFMTNRGFVSTTQPTPRAPQTRPKLRLEANGKPQRL